MLWDVTLYHLVSCSQHSEDIRSYKETQILQHSVISQKLWMLNYIVVETSSTLCSTWNQMQAACSLYAVVILAAYLPYQGNIFMTQLLSPELCFLSTYLSDKERTSLLVQH